MTDFDIVIVGGGIAGASLGAEVAGKRRTLILEGEDQCGYHSTGRSAAFYLESYGGPKVARLTTASREFLRDPPHEFSERGFLHQRGDLHLARGELPELPPGVESRVVERDELERWLPGIKPQWRRALFEPGCADIDVAALHAAYLRQFRRAGGTVATGFQLSRATRTGDRWTVTLANGDEVTASVV